MTKLWIILGSILGVVGLGVGLYFLEESYTEVILHGEKNINTTVKEEYVDQGFDLFHNNKLIDKDKYTVDIKNDVNTDTIGKYKVTYDIKYHLRKFHLEREVNVVDNVKPVITVNLEKIERDYCTKKDKKEVKYTAEDNYDGDVTEKIEKTEDEENVILKVTDSSGNTETVNIPIDYGKKPSNVLKLSGDSTVYVKLNGTYKEKGATYYDGCGKKIDEKVNISGSVDTKKTGNYTITYSVADGTKKTRKVVVYKETVSKSNINVVKLSGDSTVYVQLNDKYTEKGASYYDYDGNKTDEKINITGDVDTTKEGTYTITYSTEDGVKTTRKVVVSKEKPRTGKVLYLTFDDGPGPYTQKILNVLAKYNVKATFFVTNQFPKYVYLIKNEYQAGHAVAVHTYTHNYNVYKSVDAYVNDFNKMNNVIEKYTGTKSKLFRFPGGSSNTVSRSYAKGVVRKIANKMTSMGYTYFDWDVSSGDAAGAGRSTIYKNVVNGAARCKSCVILMHDIKSTTANELDNILKTLTSKGYRFGTLSSSSPTAHHSIAN